jgi:prevent-host-death family protein
MFGRYLLRMKIVNIYEAKTQLSRLLREVAAGTDVVIAKDGKPLARLVPIASYAGRRELGFASDRVKIADDFDAPLPADLEDAFDAPSA